MKRIIYVTFMAVCAVSMLIAEDGLTMSGEFKSGIFWYTRERDQDIDIYGVPKRYGSAFLHNSEDSIYGNSDDDENGWSNRQGRMRFNFQYDRNNIGAKFRFETNSWQVSLDNSEAIVRWAYSFVYGNFFNNNFKISGGKMGDSPWSAGGPDLWNELDTTIGFRFEFIPQFIPFIEPGSLNIGLVLNSFNSIAEQTDLPPPTIADLLSETVIGVAYTHDYFHIRFAYRMDSLYDGRINEELVYRVEERIIGKYLPGFQIWANGYFKDMNPRRLGNENFPSPAPGAKNAKGNNWLYIQYDLPPELQFSPIDMGIITRLRMGLEVDGRFTKFYFRPDVFLKLFNDRLRVGTAFEYLADVGEDKLDTKAPYIHWYIEPQVRLNLATNSYLSLVYRYNSDYRVNPLDIATATRLPNTTEAKTHSINMRLLFTF